MNIKSEGQRSSEQWPRFLSIDDLSSVRIRSLLTKSEFWRGGGDVRHAQFSVAMLMFQPSLRTRLGFAEAIHRLGGVAHLITDIRQTPDASASESLWDTLRVSSGMCDLVVIRTGQSLIEQVSGSVAPIISAGDNAEHPTQALIDLFAIEHHCGPIERLLIGISGDFTTRSARSFFKLMVRFPPARIRLMVAPSRTGDSRQLLSPIHDRIEIAQGGEWDGLDALYLTGFPKRLGTQISRTVERASYALTPVNVSRLPPNAHVFSPMPVIDEISAELRSDPRVCVYAQSDLGVAVRMAIISDFLSNGVAV